MVNIARISVDRLMASYTVWVVFKGGLGVLVTWSCFKYCTLPANIYMRRINWSNFPSRLLYVFCGRVEDLYHKIGG